LDPDRVVQLVSDTERQLFYTLTDSSIITIYKTNGEKAVMLVETMANLYRAASDKAPGNPLLNPAAFKIIGMDVMHSNETRIDCQLVAITSNGVRLYFSTIAVGYGYTYASNSGRAVQLTHIRLPPDELVHPDDQTRTHNNGVGQFSISATFSAPRPVQVSGLDSFRYSAGVTLASQPGEHDARDFILCLSPDLTRIGSFDQANKPLIEPPMFNPGSAGPQRPPLTEYASLLDIPGRTWAIAAVQQSLSTGLSAMHELSVQFSEPSRQFMILTNAGITFLAKRRPLDYLKDVIEEYHAEGNIQSLMHFRERYDSLLIHVGVCSRRSQLRTQPDMCDAVSSGLWQLIPRTWRRFYTGRNQQSGASVF
jgi:nuclear pore complex protein Nup155